MSAARHEARGAVSDALATSMGQASCFLASLVFSIFVPRLLGASVYGEWMMFRGLAIFWLTLFTLGDREVISCFYLPRKEQGDRDGAARVFKNLIAMRLVLTLPAMTGALFMLTSSSSMFRTWEAALCLAGTVFLKTAQSGFNTLIFGHRRFGRLALLDTVQAVLVPLSVMAAFGSVAPRAIPFGVLVADGLIMLATMVVSKWWREWPKGWLGRGELFQIVRYAVVISLANSIIISMNNLLLYFMNLRGYSAEALGWVGLSTRCAWVAHSGLTAVAAALMPILSTVQVRHGVQRMMRWQNFLSRVGLGLILFVAGNVLVLGPWMVPLVWGREFAPITPLLAASLVAVAALWVGAQWIRQFLLQRSTRVYIRAALLYAGVLVAVFFLSPRDETGWIPVIALLAGGVCLSAFAGFHAVRGGAGFGWLFRFVPVGLWLIAAHVFGNRDLDPAARAGYAALWSAGYVAAALLPGVFSRSEIRDLIGLLRLRGND